VSPTLSVMIAAAREAGALARAMKAAGVDRTRKDDGSLVTDADHAAEALIEDRLRAAFPGAVLLGEEAVAEGATPDLGGEWFCVDPIDGTAQFAGGDPDWAVCIGHVVAGVPVASVVFAPDHERLFAADADGGFEARADGSRTPFPRAGFDPASARVLHGANDKPERVRALAEDFGVAALRQVGSAYKFGLIACGEADVFIRAGRVWDWDVAAGAALLAAVGGVVHDLEGRPLRYGAAETGYRHPPFIARRALSGAAGGL
jgi:3'(2'),5'-bisphosphate nucleotidase